MYWKIRYIFVLLCIGGVVYLGFRTNIFLEVNKTQFDYPLIINEVMMDNRNSVRDEDGDYEAWMEIYNKGDTAVNLQGFGLSNETKEPFLWKFPERIIEPKSFCLVWLSGKDKDFSGEHLHTSFKLSRSDRALILTSANKSWRDVFVPKSIGDNISYGRRPDGAPQLYGFDEGTPGERNLVNALLEGPDTKRLNEPTFSHRGGFYSGEFYLALEEKISDAKIYYTLDSSIPTEASIQYTRPILIPIKANEATVIRARAYKEGHPKSNIISQSYFVEENVYNRYNTPVISLVTDPNNLFDYESGIYIGGWTLDQWIIKNPGIEISGSTPANYNQRGKNWEREASIELYESNGATGLVQNIGIRIFGGYSRISQLKSLQLFPRRNYDEKGYFSYDFFQDSENYSDDKSSGYFNRILLRTSASDSKYSLFRDSLIQSLVQETIILDTQASQPSIVYINGQYYGIHNIREAYDSTYTYKNYNINEEDIVILKNPTGVAGSEVEEGYAGDEMHYNRTIKYLELNDIKLDESYSFIKTQIDIENFIEYNVLQIYCDNRDWPGNNVRVWRKRSEEYRPDAIYGHDGRWRWMVFDLDYGFGLHRGKDAAINNSLERATEENGLAWPNPPWSTFLLRTLLWNEAFKAQFINTFADRLNTVFSPEAVLKKIEAMEKIYYPNIEEHITRWNLHNGDIETWGREIQGMKDFSIIRPEYLRQHIIDYFKLEGISKINVEMNEGGIVRLNTLKIEKTNLPWEGTYFNNVPIIAEAIPYPGFKFVGWEGVNTTHDNKISITLSQDGFLKAVFEGE